MAISNYYLVPPMPEGLEGLAELGLDLRWSWSHATDPLWERVDPELWNLTRNPWLILQSVSSAHLKTLAQKPAFRKQVDKHLTEHRKALEGSSWYSEAHAASPMTVAYFSMEFGLSEALPIYSGGLGILAGDHLKTASDLGVPIVGIGLLYQQGYFRQVIDAGGAQTEFYPYNDPSQLPILPVRDSEGDWLRMALDFPGRKVRLRVWEAKVGRVRLYLLDSNDPANSPADQCITAELYGGGPEMRLQQEIALGIGGWHLLRLLGIEAEVCHLNEGHAALAVLERARSCMEDTGQSFEVALTATRAGNIFTTHTAGRSRFRPLLPFPHGPVPGNICRKARHRARRAAGPWTPGSERRDGTLQHGLPGHSGCGSGQRRQPTARRGQPPYFPTPLSALAATGSPGHLCHQRRACAFLGFCRCR